MKRTILFFTLALGGSLASYSQSQRLVILEHFTQASCGPCAEYNPKVKDIVNRNEDKMVAIKYQTSWPGTDPMNKHNPDQVQTRVDYYKVSGVPSSQIDGNYYNGHPSGWSENTIYQRSFTESPMELSLSHWFNRAGDSIYASLKIKATGNVNVADLRAHIVIIERAITFSSPPGSNGEKEFEHVMKQMLPSDQGTKLSSNWSAGKDTTINVQWAFKNVYDFNQLAVVAFVQNNDSKEIFQAGYSAPKPPFMMNVSADQFSNFIAAGQTQSLDINFATDVATDESYHVQLTKTLPAGWAAVMVVDGYEYAESVDFTASASSPKKITLKVTSGDKTSEKASLSLAVNSSTNVPVYKVKEKVTFFTPVSTLLYHKDPDNSSAKYVASLKSTSHAYAVVTEEEFNAFNPSQLTRDNVKSIWLNTGSVYENAIAPAEARVLTAYLDAGGKLLVTGARIGYGMFEVAEEIPAEVLDLYSNYLGLTYYDNGNHQKKTVTPVTEDAVYGGMESTVLPTGTILGDVILTNQSQANAKITFSYGGDVAESSIGARNFDDSKGWKTAYLGTRYDQLTASSFRDAFADRTIKWFESGSTAVNNEEANNAVMIYPNPANERVVLSVQNAVKGNGSVAIFNSVGQLTSEYPAVNLSENFSVHTANMPVGLYMVVIKGENLNYTGKLNVIH